jgi:predicted nucleotidyltransferase component of viral defense system
MNSPRRRRFSVRVAEIQRRTGIPHASVLRDHALGYMLAGIGSIDDLAQHAVFKGGTALRKCYFAGYRYSEDLDFSTRDLHSWTSAEMNDLLNAACAAAQRFAEGVEAPYTFTPRAERHRDDRTDTQHNFRITVNFPTGATLPIKFELTQVEPVVRPIEVRSISHDFAEESLTATIPVYALDEIVLEKLRAFLQTAANLERRDWTNRARDLYDLWWLWAQRQAISWPDLRESLGIKAAARNVSFSGPEDFLDVRVLRSYRDSWSTRLANVVPELPAFTDAVDALRFILAVVFDIEPLRVDLA